MSNHFPKIGDHNPTTWSLLNTLVQSSLESLPYHYTIDVKQMSREMTTLEQLEHLRLVKSLVYRFRFDWWLKSRLLVFGFVIFTAFGIATVFNLLVSTIVLSLQVLLLALILGIIVMVLASVLMCLIVILQGSGDVVIVAGIGFIAVMIIWFVVYVIQGVGQNIFERYADLNQNMINTKIQVDRIVFDTERQLLVVSSAYTLIMFVVLQNLFNDDALSYGWIFFGHIILAVFGGLKDRILETVGAIITSNQQRLSSLIDTIENSVQ